MQGHIPTNVGGEVGAMRGKPPLYSEEICCVGFGLTRSRQRSMGSGHRKGVKETQRDRQKPYKDPMIKLSKQSEVRNRNEREKDGEYWCS